MDTPLSAFLLFFLQPPSYTSYQLSTQRTEGTLSDPGWGARMRGWMVVASLNVDLSVLWLMGAEGVMGFGQGKKK